MLGLAYCVPLIGIAVAEPAGMSHWRSMPTGTASSAVKIWLCYWQNAFAIRSSICCEVRSSMWLPIDQ
jgi:hypothetical protein